jgi:hypothetical protein
LLLNDGPIPLQPHEGIRDCAGTADRLSCLSESGLSLFCFFPKPLGTKLTNSHFGISESFHPQAGDRFVTGFHTVLPSTFGGEEQPELLSRTGLAEASEITGIPPASGT